MTSDLDIYRTASVLIREHGDEANLVAAQVTSAAWSPGFETNVSISMVNRDLWEPGTELTVEAPDGPRKARVQEKFWR